MWIASHLPLSRRRTAQCAVDSLGLLATGEEGHVGQTDSKPNMYTRSERFPVRVDIGKLALAISVTRLTVSDRLNKHSQCGTLRERIDTTCHSTFVLAKVCEPAKTIDGGSQVSLFAVEKDERNDTVEIRVAQVGTCTQDQQTKCSPFLPLTPRFSALLANESLSSTSTSMPTSS